MLLPILALFGLANGDTFSTSNIQLMHGIDFDKVIGNQVDDKFSTLTYENFTAWEYGDNYFFADFTHATFKNDKKYEIYAELSPRFSISKISNQNLSVGILKDVYVAGTVEQGDGFQNRLGGLSVDLDLPYFSIFSITQTVRKDYFDEKKICKRHLFGKCL
ncbi:MAG: hypothetical protein HXX81_00310 [Campylobacterales bacterium]|nr:hypothetical protein [Campylobacterales bacterium]